VPVFVSTRPYQARFLLLIALQAAKEFFGCSSFKGHCVMVNEACCYLEPVTGYTGAGEWSLKVHIKALN